MNKYKKLIYIIIGVPIALILLLFAIPTSVVFYVHSHCYHVNSNIAASDLAALNDWAIGVYQRSGEHGKVFVDVDPKDYCEVIKSAQPTNVFISKNNDYYTIHIILSGAFVPTSVTVEYDKTKTAKQCVRSGK